MQLPVLLDVLNELDWVQHAASGEFIQSPLSGAGHELFPLYWEFPRGVCLDCREFFVVVRLVKVHEGDEVVQVSLVFGVEDLILVVVHLAPGGIAELC